MDVTAWAWASFLAVVLVVLTILRRGRGSQPQGNRLPPGPKPWPVIGNLNLIGALPHRSIHELSKQYGPLMQLRFGSFPVVVGSSAEMARFFLKTHDKVFADRPRTAAGKHTTYNYSDVLWAPYNAHFRRARRLFATELFSAARLKSYKHIRHEEVSALLRDLAAAAHGASGRAVPLRGHLFAATNGIISRLVLGKKYAEKEAAGSAAMALEDLSGLIEEFFLLNGVINVGDFIPWFDWLDLQGYVRRMKKYSKKMDRFLEHVLEEHEERRRVKGEQFVARDMVDVLLQLADNPNRLDRDTVKALTQELIVGGSDTSSVTMEWAMSEVLRNPEVLGKATKELDRVVGRDRMVMEKDIPDLPYIEAIVKEAMRMHPVSPMLAPHLAREDASVNGHDIPAGTLVLVNVWAIGRDPTYWDAPEEFRPERFMGSKIDVKGQDMELLPFGAGRRMCPGYSLGLKVVQLIVANLLHGFTWGLPDGTTREQLNMEEIYGLTTARKFPLEAVVEPKLQEHVFS
ncbi:dimethylnonatriene synthase [Aegilops tauschii subsp. strangulata]|uniref:dimethylnonatriene synthase n=1 Tax=Aegilops tauschii subsp. strangulata TaxID=200361 RepID=UPI000989B404|nr:dimethylnonatriene synthase isoform X2 [Aegilops tauschii subsp. strangulata]